MKALRYFALPLVLFTACAEDAADAPPCKPLTTGELAAIQAGIQANIDGDAEYKAFDAFRKANQAAIAAAELDKVGSQIFTWNGTQWTGSGSQGYSTYDFPGGEVLTVSGGGGLVTRTFVGDAFKYEIVTSANGDTKSLGNEWGVSQESVAAFGVVRDRERRWFPGGSWSDTDEGSGPSNFELTYSVDKFEVAAKQTKDGLDTDTSVKLNGSARCASSLEPLDDAFPDVAKLLQLEL